MAYETGTANSHEDLMQKLGTFLSSNGWTQDEFSAVNDTLAVHIGNLYVQFRWDNVATISGGIAIFQSLGYAGGTAPGNQANDSGNGLVDAVAPYNSAVTSGRRVNIPSQAYTAYYFFSKSTAPAYCYVVVEYSAGLYRHFGFGNISKIGNWTGGEFAYGHVWGQATSDIDTPASGSHCVLLDGISNGTDHTPTMHVEGLADQPVGGKWGVVSQAAAVGNDRGGTGRIELISDARAGNYFTMVGFQVAGMVSGYIPMIPLSVWYRYTTPTPDRNMLLGFVPDLRMVQMKNISIGQEFSVGGDTWKVFPLVRKQRLLANTEESWNAGVAYKKIV